MSKSCSIRRKHISNEVLSRRQFMLTTVGAGVALGSVKWPAVARTTEVPDARMLARKVADAVLRDFPEPPPFNWGEGTLLTGMMRAHELTRDNQYLQFVRRFADYHYERGISTALNERGYCGHWGPGYPMLMLYEATRTPLRSGLVATVGL